ncbi:hypothetical protein SASPL_135795 [Salvia splendens]|uniref:Uncharacterized protein n=1 Tax=Salvia splendens TaxID=180675 RepID=A0A8X8WYS5_SALSN|nr:hypothetical protein SASPL_135795 [Salvia splendens]
MQVRVFKTQTYINRCHSNLQPSISRKMRHSATIYQEISLFRSRIQNRWVDDVTIRVLESILVSKDVQSSIDFKSVLKRFMRDESLLIFGEIAEESVEIKLTCAEFLIRVFAMIGDVESCLALRYEALVLRDEMATIHPELQVTSKEWLTFTEHSLENGFHSIANQVNFAILVTIDVYIPLVSCAIHLESDYFFHDVNAMEKIDRLKDDALLKISSQSRTYFEHLLCDNIGILQESMHLSVMRGESTVLVKKALKIVQAQAKAYSKRKKVKESAQQLTIPTESQKGSSRFRSGIKTHNLRKLLEYQCLRRLSL